MGELNALVKRIHETAKEKGWWDEPRGPLEIHALIHSEIAEATEECRNGSPCFYQYYTPDSDEENILKLNFKGRDVFVDKRDWELHSGLSWYISNDGNSDYLKANKGKTSVSFHNLIIEPLDGFVVDHVDGNTLNNLRGNLRSCTPSQNQANQKKQIRKKTSKFKGVYYSKIKNKWIAQIGFKKKHIHIGNYDSEKDAACAYDSLAIELFGTFAKTNILEVGDRKIIVFPHEKRWNKNGKVEGHAVELVDAVIRILDFFGHNGWNFDEIKDILENTVGDVGYKSAVESIKSPLEFHAFVHAIIASASHEFITTGGNEDGEHYLVRVVDVIRRYFVTNGWDFEEILKAKMEYNKTRPYRHGGKKY